MRAKEDIHPAVNALREPACVICSDVITSAATPLGPLSVISVNVYVDSDFFSCFTPGQRRRRKRKVRDTALIWGMTYWGAARLGGIQCDQLRSLKPRTLSCTILLPLAALAIWSAVVLIPTLLIYARFQALHGQSVRDNSNLFSRGIIGWRPRRRLFVKNAST